MTRESLFVALHETRHALRFAEAAATWFSPNAEELESGSGAAAAIAYISNQLADAHSSLSSAEIEIGKLLQEENRA